MVGTSCERDTIALDIAFVRMSFYAARRQREWRDGEVCCAGVCKRMRMVNMRGKRELWTLAACTRDDACDEMRTITDKWSAVLRKIRLNKIVFRSLLVVTLNDTPILFEVPTRCFYFSSRYSWRAINTSGFGATTEREKFGPIFHILVPEVHIFWCEVDAESRDEQRGGEKYSTVENDSLAAFGSIHFICHFMSCSVPKKSLSIFGRQHTHTRTCRHVRAEFGWILRRPMSMACDIYLSIANSNCQCEQVK